MISLSRKSLFILVILSIFCCKAAFASEELDTLVKSWPADSTPFNEWKLDGFNENIAEFTLQLQHKTSSEKLTIALHLKNEQEQSYAKTRLYNVFYISSKQDSHTSPEAEVLLPKLVEWIRTVEGEKTLLPEYKAAIEAEKLRVAEEKERIRQQRELEHQRFKMLKKKGIRKILGSGQQLQNFFGENILVLVLFIACLVFCIPRVNKMHDELEVDDVNYLRKWMRYAIPISAIFYAFVAIKPYNVDAIAAIQSTDNSPGFNALAFIVEKLVAANLLSPEMTYASITALIFALSSALVMYVAYTLFWNRRIAVIALFLYLVISTFCAFLSAKQLTVVALIADLSLAILFISLSFFVHDSNRKWLVIFAAPAATLLIWIEPAYYILLLFMPIYVLIEAEDLKETVTSYKGWLVYLFIIMFSLPVFQLLLPDNGFASMTDVFFGSFAKFTSLEGIELPTLVSYSVYLQFVFFAFVISRNYRKMYLYFAGLLCVSAFLSFGLPIYDDMAKSCILLAVLSGCFVFHLFNSKRSNDLETNKK